MKVEFFEMDFVCDAVVQSSVTVNDILHHPRSGRTADNKQEVLLR